MADGSEMDRICSDPNLPANSQLRNNCACRDAAKQFSKNSSSVAAATKARDDWRNNYTNTFLEDYRNKRAEVDAQRFPWDDPRFDAAVSGYFTNPGADESTDTFFSQNYVFWPDPDVTTPERAINDFLGINPDTIIGLNMVEQHDSRISWDSFVNVGINHAKSAVLCKNKFEEYGEESRCTHFYPNWCPKAGDCRQVNVGNDNDISWSYNSYWQTTSHAPWPFHAGQKITDSDHLTEGEGDCDGLSPQAIYACERTDTRRAEIMDNWKNDWKVYPENSENLDYYCNIPYDHSGDYPAESCANYIKLRSVPQFPASNIQCCSNYIDVNLSGDHDELSHISQRCQQHTEQLISNHLNNPDSGDALAGSAGSSSSPSTGSTSSSINSSNTDGGDDDDKMILIGTALGILILIICLILIIVLISYFNKKTKRSHRR